MAFKSILIAENRHRANSKMGQERWDSEAALRESEERYRRLFELCPDAVLVHSAGKIVLLNSAGAELLGAESPEQVIGKPVLELVHPDYLDVVRERIATVHKGGSVARMEQQVVRLDGTLVDVEVTAGGFIYRNQPAVQVILRDIRKRKRLQFQNAQITQLSHRLNSATTPGEAAQIIVETADTLLGWDACDLSVYSPEEDKVFTLVTMDEMHGQRRHAPSRRNGREPTPWQRRVMTEGGRLILRPRDKEVEAGLIPFGDTSRPSASLLFAPIRNGSRVIGLMSIQSYRVEAYSKADLALLQFLADHCGGALERLRAEEASRASEAQLRSLATHLQSVREEERIRIAREIHDELGQLLTGFKMDLSWLEKRLTRPPDEIVCARLCQKLSDMSGMVDDMVDSVRRISAELRPGVLDGLGLVPAMEWQMMEFQKRSGIRCQLASTLETNDLPSALCTNVFRILQETLTNVARHAKATRVKVSLEQMPNALLMRIQDNGRGITEQELADPKSLGLAGMRERALALGGEFRICAAPGGGTLASVSIPLASSPKR